jgi:ABC-type transporter Mla MlaB component
MSEVTTETEKRVLTPEEQNLQQVSQVISNAVAALMDVANLLRDIPKLVAANQALVAQLQSAGVPLPSPTQSQDRVASA